METKNEALELAQKLQDKGFCGTHDLAAATVLRSQAAGIEKLKAQVESALICSENANKLSAECLRERDQLKAKNFALAYKIGHRDARHAAAELSIAYANGQKSGDAHEIWAAAQIAPGEGIADGVARVEALLGAPRVPMTDAQIDDSLPDAIAFCAFDTPWTEKAKDVMRSTARAVEQFHGIGVKS